MSVGPSGERQCPLCHKVMREQGHHRGCDALFHPQAQLHDKVRDAIARAVNACDVATARTEVDLLRGQSVVRADVVVRDIMTGSRLDVEIKTVDLRCDTHVARRHTLMSESTRLHAEIDLKYNGGATAVVVDAAGNHTARTAKALKHLRALCPPTSDAGRVPLIVRIGEACAKAEAESFGLWRDACTSIDAARRLAMAEGLAAGGAAAGSATQGGGKHGERHAQRQQEGQGRARSQARGEQACAGARGRGAGLHGDGDGRAWLQEQSVSTEGLCPPPALVALIARTP